MNDKILFCEKHKEPTMYCYRCLRDNAEDVLLKFGWEDRQKTLASVKKEHEKELNLRELAHELTKTDRDNLESRFSEVEDVVKKNCVCEPEYKGRDLISPRCPTHDIIDEISKLKGDKK